MTVDTRLRCSICGNPVDGDGEVCADCIADGRAERELGRRKFLRNSLIGAMGLFGVGYLGLALKNLFPASGPLGKLQNIGPINKFTNNYTLIDYTGAGFPDGVYVRQKSPGVIQAFDFHCAHLQCPVQWNSSLKEFQCPCHGSVYNANGQHIAGPAPRGLWPHVVKIANGNVYIGGQID
jgi:cytochrome b6-f complex iron-sulfur subunit